MCAPFEYSRKRIAPLFLVALWIATAAPLLAQPLVTIVKSTNGQDANAPPGPVVTVGSTVTWTYVITNSGGRDLINVAVTDDQIGAVSCPATTLPAGTSMTCTATGTAAAGQYTNIGTVNADEMGGGPVTASDSSHYFGQPAGLITLVKATNGQDANLPPGPSIAVGAAVNWTYVVTNAGSQSITNVAVTDDQGVVVTCPQNTLAASQSMTCTASGTAIAGQYSNIGTATATHPTFGTIVASDPSHYFGQTQNFDFGDAPDSYGTTFAVNGAHHAVGTNVYLGACVDQELDGQPSAAANGDDANAGTSFGTCAVAGADEDGVTFNSSLTVGQPASITVVANAPCTLSAWIDFNINGNFSDPSDALFSSGVNLVAGSNPLMFTVPSTAAGGSTYARFRCTTDGVVGPLGAARDGEVEDYRVTIVPVADLSITKTDAPDPVTPGTNLSYTIAVNNAGPSSAATVALSDTLPASTTFVSLTSPGGWSCTTPAVGSNGTVSCSTASLAVGSAVFTLIVKVDAGTSGMITNTATVSAATSDLVPGNNSGTATTTVAPPQADLSVTKTDAPDPVTPGTNLTYTITVNSAGPSNASTVAMSDTLPAGTTFVSFTSPAGWSCTTPAIGSNGTVSCSMASLTPGSAVFTLVVKVDAGAGGSITNTATISSATSDPIPGNNSGTATTTVGAAQADLSVTKTDAPDPVTPGTNLTYTITVNNAGPSNAATVALSDPLPASTTFVSLSSPGGWSCTTPAVGSNGAISCTVATLAPGNAVFTLVVNVVAGATGSITNTATISSATTDTVPANNSGTATTAVGAGQADLSVTKVDAPDPVTPGTNLTYTITVNNAGPSSATTVALSDPLPASTTFVSLTSPAGWTCTTPAVGASGTISCSVASLAPGNVVFTLVVNVATGASGSITNTATVSSATTDATPANNSGTATTAVGAGQADLSVTKTDAPDPITPGANLTYTITVNNAGPSNAATVAMSDTLPASTTFVSLTSPAGWTCTTPAVGANGTISCTAASLAPGNSVFTLVVMVSTSASGTITNTATVSSVTSDSTPTNNSGTAITTVGSGQADLSVTKTGSPNLVSPGANIAYTITVNNAGPSNALTVALSDPLPPNTTFVSLTSPAGWTCTTPAAGSTGTISCTVAVLSPGSASFTLVVKAAANADATITNTATVSSATSDPIPGNNSGTATTVNPQAIPTLSPKALMLLILMLAGLGALFVRTQ